MSKYYKCRCFFKGNIYVKEFKSHVIFDNEQQFLLDYKHMFDKLKCKDDETKIIKLVQEEILRRKNIDRDSLARKTVIANSYKYLDPDIVHLKEKYFKPSFLNVVETSKMGNLNDLCSQIEILSKEKELYRIPVFTDEFCNQLLAELDNFRNSSLPKGRPNSMNHHGVLLDELGFYDHFIDPLRTKYLNPIAKMLYPKWCGKELDTQRAFTVLYQLGKDQEIDCHYDNSEVTLNICLGKEFSDGELYFGNMKDDPSTSCNFISIQQLLGHGIFHRGEHVHGTMPITCGERHNMIIWMRSSSVRNEKCPMCNMNPDLIASDDYGDGFTAPDSKSCSVQ